METVCDEGVRLRRCLRNKVRFREAWQAAERHKDQVLAREQAAHAEAESARQRLAFLAEAGTWLAASLNYETTLARLPRLVVPFLADWCGIYAAASEPSPRLVAVAHVDPVREETLREMRRRYPLELQELHPVTQVLQTGRHSIRRCPRRCS
jgi:hypothetical protein